MGARERRKGKVGELEVARWLYRAHYGMEPARDREVFVRTKPGVRQREGDLVVPADFPFYVEVKNRPICLTHLLRKEWQEMVAEAWQRAREARRRLLMVIKVHRTWWVLCDVFSEDAQLQMRCDGESLSLLPLSAFCHKWGQSCKGTCGNRR